jgi:hypothetical protein
MFVTSELVHAIVEMRAIMVMSTRSLSLCALLVIGTLAMPATGRAAPPGKKSPEPEVVCEPTPTLEDAKLMTARDLHIRGEQSFEKGDYLGAVEAWEQVLVLMPDKRADLRVPLAHAHRRAYAVDDDTSHLTSAHTLFGDQLAALAPDDAAREDLEAEIADIEATFAAIAEAEKTAQAEREEAIRQEQIRINEQVLAAATAKHQRNVQKIYYGVGGSLAGIGLSCFIDMGVYLAAGAKLDREGQAAAGSTGVSDGYYEQLLDRGQAKNRAAIGTGVAGGVLVLAGASLLIVAAVRHKRVIVPLERKRVAVFPTLGGVHLRF